MAKLQQIEKTAFGKPKIALKFSLKHGKEDGLKLALLEFFSGYSKQIRILKK